MGPFVRECHTFHCAGTVRRERKTGRKNNKTQKEEGGRRGEEKEGEEKEPARDCHSSIWEAELGGSQVPGQRRLQREILSQKNKIEQTKS